MSESIVSRGLIFAVIFFIALMVQMILMPLGLVTPSQAFPTQAPNGVSTSPWGWRSGGSDSRTVFVQMFEWPWLDVAQECEDYLGPNGFAAVQVSPPQEHLDLLEGFWWTRYQPVSYKILSRSGTEAQFKEMVDRCHQAGVGIYVDVVLNHMAGYESGKGFGGTSFQHYTYPGLYGYNDFHHCGRGAASDYEKDRMTNFQDLYEVQNCELVHLADLGTELPSVQRVLGDYLTHLLDLGVDGFRVDAAKHMPPQDIQEIFQRVRYGHHSPYIFLELILGINDPTPAQDYLAFADIDVFGYPYIVGRAFKNHQLPAATSIGQVLAPADRAVVFLENHDLQRSEDGVKDLLSYRREPELFKVANVFLLTWPYGYPQIFSGYNYTQRDDGPPQDPLTRFTIPVMENQKCRAPWLCEHRLPGVAALVQFHNFTSSFFGITNYWTNGSDLLAFGRAQLGFVMINASEQDQRFDVETDLADGSYCNILDEDYSVTQKTCPRFKALRVEGGRIQLRLVPHSAVVLQANVRPQ